MRILAVEVIVVAICLSKDGISSNSFDMGPNHDGIYDLSLPGTIVSLPTNQIILPGPVIVMHTTKDTFAR